MTRQAYRVLPSGGALRGSPSLPGDKSVSHRALLLNSLGTGEAMVRGINDGADVQSSAQCLRALGVSIVATDGGLLVRGRGGEFRTPSSALDCGNSGTTMRLLAGMLAAQPFTATLDGDESLRSRPMARIAKPLRELGARVEGPDFGEHPPLIITGAELESAEFELSIASAQLKSCILLAAVAGGIDVSVREPAPSRDHTEKLLLAMGAKLRSESGWIHYRAADPLHCIDIDVPRDPSAAALLAVTAASIPSSEIQFRGVLLNPTRVAFLEALERMGVSVRRESASESAGESIGDVVIRAADQLKPLQVSPGEVPSLLDEIPALAALAAFAPGRSVFSGIAELRVKESDRVRSIEMLCESFGIAAGSDDDSLWIDGGQPSWCERVDPGPDHRMVMAAVAMAVGSAARCGKPIEVSDIGPAAVSFGDYPSALESIGVAAD